MIEARCFCGERGPKTDITGLSSEQAVEKVQTDLFPWINEHRKKLDFIPGLQRQKSTLRMHYPKFGPVGK